MGELLARLIDLLSVNSSELRQLCDAHGVQIHPNGWRGGRLSDDELLEHVRRIAVPSAPRPTVPATPSGRADDDDDDAEWIFV